ncbi:hypothetical protein ACFCV8_08180 [Streptomyces sp. NPDC056347]|uniref:hypothetical protein n=1 Tax=Streptomyces sp. NPDC056347 TaxID=3345790 RepID=UPI0035D80743
MSIMTCATAATIPVLGTGNRPNCGGDFESCRCTGVAQTSTTTLPRAGLIGDMTEDDDRRGFERDETDTFHRLVQRLVDHGDDRAQKAGHHARRTYAEMVPGPYTRQPVLRMTTTDIVFEANQECQSCGGQGGRTEDTSSDGVTRQNWVMCRSCNGSGQS